jgi:hypothetical protein
MRLGLFGFLVDDVFAYDGVVFAQFETLGRITTIFHRVVHVTTFTATQFDQYAITFFRHIDHHPLFTRIAPQILKTTHVDLRR